MATSLLPSYPEMIMVALDGLNEENGSNKTSISKYIESKYQNLPAGHATLLKHHLNRMKDCGQLTFWKNNYMRPRPDFIKRGRGRPPKAKDGMPTSDGQARPRGRPRKDEMASGDPSGASVPLKKKKVSADNGEQPTGVKRGRGRPPKAKPPTGGEGVSAQA
ncbi:hypothetical protein vseg_007526 [Gypsophila vaccaria]